MSITFSYFFAISIIIAPIIIQQKISKTTILKSATRQKILLLVTHAFLILITFSIIYCYWGLKYEGAISHSLQDAIYFSIVTWTTLGYGDFQPTEEIRVLASAQALTGYVFMAITIANLLETYREEQKEAFERPIRKQITDQCMVCLHTISSSLLFSILIGKSYRPGYREHMLSQNNDQIQKLNFMLNLHKEVVTAQSMQAIYKIITSYQALDKISNMNYHREKFTNPTITKNPLVELENIEECIKIISKGANYKPIDSRPITVSSDAIGEKWGEFKKEYSVIDQYDNFELKESKESILFFDKSLLSILEKSPDSIPLISEIKTFYN